MNDPEMHVVVVSNRSSGSSILPLDGVCILVFFGRPNTAAKVFSDTAVRVVADEHDERSDFLMTLVSV
jgi:hypothetical protein